MIISEMRLRSLIRGKMITLMEGQRSGLLLESEQAQQTGYYESGSTFWRTWPTAPTYGTTGFKLNDQKAFYIIAQYFKKTGVDITGGGTSRGMQPGDMCNKFNIKAIYEEQSVKAKKGKESEDPGERAGIFLSNLVKNIENVTQDKTQYMSANVHIVFCNFESVLKNIAKVYAKLGGSSFTNKSGGVDKFTKEADTYFAAIAEVVKRVAAYREKKGIYFDFYKNLGTYEGYDFGESKNAGSNSSRRQERQKEMQRKANTKSKIKMKIDDTELEYTPDDNRTQEEIEKEIEKTNKISDN